MVRAAETARTYGQGASEPGLLDYLRILWRHKLLILTTVIVVTGTVVGLDRERTRQYQGTADLLFTAQGAPSSSSSNALNVPTDIELVPSTPVVAEVSKLLAAPAPPVSVTQVGTTDVAQITVRSTSPTFAANAANAYAKAYIQVATKSFVTSQLGTQKQIQAQVTAVQGQIKRISDELTSTSTSPSATTTSQLQSQLTGLYGQLSSLQQQLSQLQLATAQGSSAGQLVTPAVSNSVPISPKKTQDAVIAAALGLLLGFGFALLRDHLDDRIRGVDDLESAVGGLPAIGLVPALSDWRNRKTPYLVSVERPRSPAAEAYRALRTSVQFMALERPVRILQVTSPGAVEGKSTTSSNLAYAMAEATQRVVLVDCDLRRPRVHEFFKLSNEIGLTSVLLGKATLEQAVVRVPGHSGLLVLPAGPVPPNPSELLSGEDVARQFRILVESSDLVILDSSPVLPVTDAVVLAARVDGVLLVASAGVTTARALKRTIELLGQVDARLIGTVLNRAPEAGAGSYYRYGYGDEIAVPTPAVANGTNGIGAISKATSNGTNGNSPNGEGHEQLPENANAAGAIRRDARRGPPAHIRRDIR